MPDRSSDNGSVSTPVDKRRGVFRLKRVIGALMVFVLLVLSGAVFLHRQLISAYAPGILDQLAREMEVYYDLEFTWNGYRIDGLSDFTITGISITDIPSGMNLLSCDSFRLRSSLWALTVRGRDVMGSVTSVELENPVFDLGRQEGRWNTGKLLEPSEGEAFQFPGRLGIILHDGLFVWRGGEISDGIPLPPMQIAGVQGLFRLSTDSGMGLDIEGMLSGSDLVPAPVKITGIYNPETYLIRLNLEGEGVDLGTVAPWLDKYSLNLDGGLADTNVSFLFGPSAGESGFSMLGNADIRDLKLTTELFPWPFENLTGDLHFSNKSVFTTGLNGSIEGSPFNINGRIGNFSEVSFDTIVETDNMPLGTLRKMVPGMEFQPIDGRVTARAEILGFRGNREAILNVSSASLSAFAVPFGVNDLLAWYSDDKVTIRYCEFGFLGGTVAADGVVDLANSELTYEFDVAARGMSSSELSPYIPFALDSDLIPDGDISSDFSISGTGTEFPSAAGVIEIAGCKIPRYRELGPLSIVIPVEATERGLRVTGASATTDGLTVLAEGEFSPGAGFEGSVVATTDDADLLSTVSGFPVRGELALGGDLSAPASGGVSLEGEVQLINGALGSMSVPEMSGRFGYDGSALRLSELSGFLGNATIDGELIIPLDGQASEVEGGSFRIQGLDLSPIFPPEYGSTISTSVTIEGNVSTRAVDTGRALVFDLNITEPAGSVGSGTVFTRDDGLSVVATYPLDSPATASVTISGSLEFKPDSVPMYQGRVLTSYSETVVGRITDLLTGQTRTVGTEGHIRIPQIAGVFDLSADLSDLTGLTRGSIRVIGEGISVAGWEMESATLDLASEDGAAWDLSIGVTSTDSGSFELTGVVDRGPTLLESPLGLIAKIHDSGLNQVFDLLGLSELGRFSGSLSGEGEIGGTLSAPEVDSFELNLSESEAFGIPITEGGITFGYSPPTLSLSELKLEGSDGFTAMGAGNILLDAPSLANANLVLRLNAFDLSLLDPLADEIGKPIPVGGVISGTIQLAQDALGPKVLYNANIQDAFWKTTKGNLPLGEIHLEAVSRPGDPQIDLTSLKLTRDGESIEASGLIPSSLAPPLGIDIFDLSIVSETGYTPEVPEGLLASGFSWDGGLGPVNLEITGPITRPIVSGDFALDVGNVLFNDIQLIETFEGTYRVIDSAITASPDEVRATGKDWELGVDGKLNLLAFWPYYPDRSLAIRHPDAVRLFAVPLTPGPVRINPKDDLSLDIVFGEGDETPSLRWSDGRLALAGTVSVLGGKIDIASFSEFDPLDPSTEPGALLFDFDVDLEGNLAISNGSMFELYFQSGSLNLAGPATYPTLVGALQAPEGWIDINVYGLSLGRFLIIEPVELSFSSVYRFDPHITATGRGILRDVMLPDQHIEELIITARMNGRMSTMMEDAELTSIPPLSRDQLIAAAAYDDMIIRTIGGSLFGESFGAPGFEDVRFETVLLPFASNYLSRFIRKQTGLTDFELSLDHEQRVRLYIESKIFDNMFMYYQQTFNPDEEYYYRWGARYRWRPRSWVGFELDSEDDFTPQVEYIIPLD